MEKLIQQSQEKFIVCDNTKCEYEVPFDPNLKLLEYIDKPCPCCGDNLLTIEDYMLSLMIQKTIDFINKWFSWILWFCEKPKEEDYSTLSVHIHDGLKIKKEK